MRNEIDDLSVLKKKIKKNDKIIFSLVWNIMFTSYLKFLALKFWEMENTSFFRAEKLMEI